jgi:uncharacterized protein
MDRLSAYNIAFKGLLEGIHEFDYQIGRSFFEHFENSPVDDGNIDSRVILEKRSSFMSLHLKVSGTVVLTCDRCLELFDQKIKNQGELYIKFGETPSEEGDDVIWLLPEEHQFNVAQIIYEFIIIGIPLRHVHPSVKEGSGGCNPEMLKKIRQYSRQEPGDTDERWNELKKLLNNN